MAFNFKIELSRITFLAAAFASFGFAFAVSDAALETTTYIPPREGPWGKIQFQEAGWKPAPIEQAVAYAGGQKSSGLLILVNGKILVEEYWSPKKAANLEDIASMQKSITSLLIGIAVSKELLKIEDPVSQYLSSGWPKAETQKEEKILIKHLLTMSSGLNYNLGYRKEPGTFWDYNTRAYANLTAILEKVSEKDLATVTKEWLTDPLGITESGWQKRPNDENNPNGYFTTLKDLAKIGLLALNRGSWGSEEILKNKQYLTEAFTPFMALNEKNVIRSNSIPYEAIHYGYLWFLNTGSAAFTKLPEDMIWMYGAGERLVFILPKAKVVIVRLGNKPETGFDQKLLDLIAEAMPRP